MTLKTYISVLLLALLLSAASFSDGAYLPCHRGKPPQNPLTEQHNSQVNGHSKPPCGRPLHNPLTEELSLQEQLNSDVNGYHCRRPPIQKPPTTNLQNELSVNTESIPKGGKKHDPTTVLKKQPYEPGLPVVVETVPPKKKRKPPPDNTETTPRKQPRNPPTTN